MNIYFWLVNKKTVGKKEDRLYFIYNKHKEVWEIDDTYYISDSIFGYDAGEEAGSPYSIGNMDIMDRCEEISEEKAMKILSKGKG